MRFVLISLFVLSCISSYKENGFIPKDLVVNQSCNGECYYSLDLLFGLHFLTNTSQTNIIFKNEI